MAEPKIIVKVRRPSGEFDDSDSDFELLSDTENDGLENGYKRLQDDKNDHSNLESKVIQECDHIEYNSEFLGIIGSSDSLFVKNDDKKLLMNLSEKQIQIKTSNHLLNLDPEVSHSKSTNLLPLEYPIDQDVAVPCNDLQFHGPRSVSTNFVDRLTSMLHRRHTLVPIDIDEKNETRPNSESENIPQKIPSPTLSDSVVIKQNKGLNILQEVSRKVSMPLTFPSPSTQLLLPPQSNNSQPDIITTATTNNASNNDTNDGNNYKNETESEATTKLLFPYRTFNNVNSIDLVRNE